MNDVACKNPECSETFALAPGVGGKDRRYHSRKCGLNDWRRAHPSRVDANCAECGRLFKRDHPATKLCSKECKAIALNRRRMESAVRQRLKHMLGTIKGKVGKIISDMNGADRSAVAFDVRAVIKELNKLIGE